MAEEERVTRSHWPAIVIIALLVRIVAAFVDFGFQPVPDFNSWAMENVAITLSLDSGQGYSSPFFVHSGPTAWIPPGYPFFLAAIIRALGTGVFAATFVIALQISLSLMTVWIVMYVARTQFGIRSGNLAGFIAAIAPSFFMAPLWLWDTSLSQLFLIGIFAAMPFFSGRRWGFIAAGATSAVAALFHPGLIPSLFAICIIFSWRVKRAPWTGLLVFVVAFSPWPVRNLHAMHSFIPFRSNFAHELWMGNHPGGDGEYDKRLDPMMNPELTAEFVSKGEVGYLRDRGAQAKAFIYSDPRNFLHLTVRRIVSFWIGSQGSTAVLFLPACAGLILLRKRRSLFLLYLLPLILFPLPYYVTHTDLRYEYPIAPLLAILFAYAIDSFLTFMRPGSEILTVEHSDVAKASCG